MHLFTITISTLNQQNNVQLLFSDEGRAYTAYQFILGVIGGHADSLNRIAMDDDYGNLACLRRDVIAHIVLTDLTKSAQGNQDMAIFNAHAQIKLQKRADADDEIKRAQTGQALKSGLMNGGARA